PLSVPPTPPSSTLFPYTTLFRSLLDGLPAASGAGDQQQSAEGGEVLRELSLVGLRFAALHLPEGVPGQGGRDEGSGDRPRRQSRSEEHTSELQSRFDLVCRLLLE